MALIEGFMVVYGLAIADNVLISGYRSCGVWGITVSTPSYVVET